MFIGKTDAEAPMLWPPDMQGQLIGKDPDAGKGRRQEGKGTTEDEMVGWYHQLNEHESEQTLRDGEGQGILACCIHGVTERHEGQQWYLWHFLLYNIHFCYFGKTNKKYKYLKIVKKK